jgi:hypothetical protein
MVWSPTVATACLGLGVSALWATHAAAKKADKNKRVVNLKWHISADEYTLTAAILRDNIAKNHSREPGKWWSVVSVFICFSQRIPGSIPTRGYASRRFELQPARSSTAADEHRSSAASGPRSRGFRQKLHGSDCQCASMARKTPFSTLADSAHDGEPRIEDLSRLVIEWTPCASQGFHPTWHRAISGKNDFLLFPNIVSACFQISARDASFPVADR